MANHIESYHGTQVITGPRPKVKSLTWDNGIKVQIVESVLEMKVRMDGLREDGDQRAAERILDGLDDTWAHPVRKASNVTHGLGSD